MDDDGRWRGLFVKKLEAELCNAFRFFRADGIEPVVIKGWAAGLNYPENINRFYGDIDLAVAAGDFEHAKAILRTDKGSRLGVDLHAELRHFDTKPWAEIIKDSREIELNGTVIRAPSCEDHLRVLAVHLLNDGCTHKDRLWDIYYAVANRPADFDWDRCLACVSKIRRQWTVSAIGLAHRYLGLPIEDLPFAEEAKDLPLWLTRAVEKEWRSRTPLRPMMLYRKDPVGLLKQIKKRLPPNAIEATIEMEGSFDSRSRLGYQIRSAIKRLGPSIKSIPGMLKSS